MSRFDRIAKFNKLSKTEVLWSTSETYTPKLQPLDKNDWKGSVKSAEKKKDVKLILNIEAYKNTLEQLRKNSLELASIFLEKPNVEHAEKRAVETGNILAKKNYRNGIPILAIIIPAILILIYMLLGRK